MIAAKIDDNHKSVVRALKTIGCSVQSMANIGNGCPDLLVGYHGQNFLVEVKTLKGKTNALQIKWHQAWRGIVKIAHSPEEAIKQIQDEINYGKS